MKTILAPPLATLAVAASAVLLAGCLEQSRPAAQTAPLPQPAAAVPVREPEIIARPDPTAANVSAPVAELARLHQSGLDESVVKAFVEKSTNALSPSADELIYLKDIGVSPRVITALIQQTAKMREQVAAAAVTARPAAPAETRPNMTVIAANANPPATQPAPTAPTPQPAAVGPAPAVAIPPVQPVVVAQPSPVNLPAQVNIFYQQLQPYGTWMQVAEHGWCWQPTVVVGSPAWRPYADRGRWLYTDCGWYWQSDYAWGWAPFHYGRWVSHARSGWLWVPDTTWGPAWVVWRSSSSHCGWAPLPPSAVFVAGGGFSVGNVRVGLNFDFGLPRHHYTFIPFNRFCDRNPHYYALAPTVVQNVFNETTVINNIYVANNVVVNGGLPADRVANVTRSEIRKVSVRDTAPQESSLARLDKLEKSGNDLVIYRPVLNPNAPVKPVTLTNSKGESRTELVPAGALTGQKIAGRPVYDTTSTGVPVLTGYTTEPPVRPNVVVIHNTVNSTPPPAPVASTAPSAPANSTTSAAAAPNQALKLFGLNPNTVAARRADEVATRQPTVIIPNPADNSLYRPLTPPQPVTSKAQNLTPPTPVTTSQPVPRREVTKPQTPSPANATVVQPPAPVAPVAPFRPTPPPSAYAPTPAPTYQPSAPKQNVSIPTQPVQPQPAPPVSSRPTVTVTPQPQPSLTPATSANSGSASTTKNDQEKRK